MLWLIAVALAADCATPKDGMLIPVGTVSFDAELALTPEGAAAVASVACAVDPGGPLQVEVHTDSQGSSGYNRAMSQRRADVVRAGRDYDDSIVHTKALAAENDWILLADGSWDGYTERPGMVMEGYTVLAEECRARFAESGVWPSHVMLQAGVGGMAAAVAGHIRTSWAEQPTIVVVEPDRAPCLLESVRAGQMVRADGEISNMGRLDCKEASLLAFDSLRQDADVFVTVSDAEAQTAAARFTAHGAATTPSGGAGLAGLLQLSARDQASCLIIVSEGPEIA